MKQNKKNRSTWAEGLVVLVLAIVTTCLAGFTYAKYSSTVSGNDSATVAGWNWQINGTTLAAGTSTFTFDLFNTIKDTDGTTAETDVTAGKIAPGTSGNVAIKIDNVSDVNATYAIVFAAVNADNIPIEYSVDNATWSSDITSINVNATNIAMTNGTATVTVYWRWAFEGNDATDTALGFGGTASVTVTATATFTQVD